MRMIDRWFPCAEVSDASYQPYGSGLAEKGLFSWFAARPIAQARAAVLTTLLPWPDEVREQERLKDIVRAALKGDQPAIKQAALEIKKANPEGTRTLDPFSGRGIIPLEATRAGAESWGIDYSPVATLGGLLLADYPLRDWSAEPPLPFDKVAPTTSAMFDAASSGNKLTHDVEVLLMK